MKKKYRIVFCFAVILTILSCTPAKLFMPTPTPEPTITPTPTPTQTLTPTFTFTSTPLPTVTPTSTQTLTPVPVEVGEWYAPINVNLEVIENLVYFYFTVAEDGTQIKEWTILDSLHAMGTIGNSVDIIGGKFVIDDSDQLKYLNHKIEGTFELDRVKGTYEFDYGGGIGIKTGEWKGAPGHPPIRISPLE